MTLPHSIPPLEEVRSFSNHLHSTGIPWQGVIFGWNAEYTPERRRKPAESKMTLGLPPPPSFGLARAASGFSHACGSMERTRSRLSSSMTGGL
jgi:hypothetical protein